MPSSRLSWVTESMFAIAMAALAAMALVTALDIGLRYFVSRPIAGSYELVSYFAACCLSFSLPRLQANNGHVIVDLVIRHASARIKWALGIGVLLLSVAFFALLTWRLAVNAQAVFALRQVSDILGIPLWIIYIIAALGPAMTVPVCIDQLSLLAKRGPVYDAR